MNGYDDEFTPVNDPREYLNAPAMLMMDGGDQRGGAGGSGSPPQMPLILRAAVDYAAGFDILSADELQQYYTEQQSLGRRLADVVNRLDVELKMREAAKSISKLHETQAGGNTPVPKSPALSSSTVVGGNESKRTSFASTRSSVLGGLASPKGSNRLSRFLGQDNQSKSEKRLSKQAADEAAISAEKIKDLENLRAEIERRKSTVDKTILKHHAAVMSRALSNKPLPNHHQRSQSNVSATSQGSSSRKSWIMAPKHQRQWSSTSNTDSYVTAAAPASVSRGGPPGATSAMSPQLQQQQAQNQQQQNQQIQQYQHMDEEINSLVSRISQVLPQTSPAPQGKVAYIANAFDHMFRELSESRKNLEASRIQISHLEQQIQHAVDERAQLEVQKHQQIQQIQQKHEQQLQRMQQPNGGAGGGGSASNRNSRSIESFASTVVSPGVAGSGGDEIILKQLRHELDIERSVATQWRTRAEEQRKQLESMAKSLEDVTRLAVQLEGEHADYSQLITKLQSKVETLEAEKVDLLQQKLRSTTNTSVLCQEFQRIVSELVTRHDHEMRTLYPRFSRRRLSESRGITNGLADLSVHDQSTTLNGEHGGSQTSLTNSMHHNLSNGDLSRRGSTRSSNRYSASRSGDADDRRSSISGSGGSRRGSTQNFRHSNNHSHTTGSDNQNYNQNHQPGHNHTASNGTITYRDIPHQENRLSHLQETAARTSSPLLNRDDTGLSLPQPLETSFEESSSIQHTQESLMRRPSFERHDTEASDFSKSSSFYPESVSANQSQVSIITNSKRTQTTNILQQAREQVRRFSYEEADDDLL